MKRRHSAAKSPPKPDAPKPPDAAKPPPDAAKPPDAPVDPAKKPPHVFRWLLLFSLVIISLVIIMGVAGGNKSGPGVPAGRVPGATGGPWWEGLIWFIVVTWIVMSVIKLGYLSTVGEYKEESLMEAYMSHPFWWKNMKDLYKWMRKRQDKEPPQRKQTPKRPEAPNLEYFTKVARFVANHVDKWDSHLKLRQTEAVEAADRGYEATRTTAYNAFAKAKQFNDKVEEAIRSGVYNPEQQQFLRAQVKAIRATVNARARAIGDFASEKTDAAKEAAYDALDAAAKEAMAKAVHELRTLPQMEEFKVDAFDRDTRSEGGDEPAAARE